MKAWERRNLPAEQRAAATMADVTERVAEAIKAAERDAAAGARHACAAIARQVKDEFIEQARTGKSGVPFLQATGGRDAAAEIERRILGVVP